MSETTLPRASRRHAWLAGMLLVLGAAGLTGCSDSGSDSQAGSAGAKGAVSTLEAAKAAGKIRIGYANEAPFAYMDSQRAEVTGESVEIARVVLKRMGINQVEGVLTEFGSLIPGLQAKRFDIIAAGMYVTPERCRQAAFSNPTYGVSQALLVKQGNPRTCTATRMRPGTPTPGWAWWWARSNRTTPPASRCRLTAPSCFPTR